MPVPIIGKPQHPYIIVEMVPGIASGTFDVTVNTQSFEPGLPLAIQCLLQAIVFLIPHAYQKIAEAATSQILMQKRAEGNGER